MIYSSDPSLSKVSLSVAGIGVTLICNHPGVVKGLARRYSSFLDNGDVDLTITVDVDPNGKSRVGSWEGSEFQNGILQFVLPYYKGWIDEQRGIGNLFLSVVNPSDGIDYFMRVAYALLAFKKGGFMFHAAGIARGELVYLFFGHSGSGKTTIALLSPDDQVLNDDLIVILPKRKNWVASATPFWNPSQVQPQPFNAPVKGLYRLVKDRRVFLEKMSRGQALAELISSVPIIPQDAARSEKLVARGIRLLKMTPAYRLHFLPDCSFWDIIAPTL